MQIFKHPVLSLAAFSACALAGINAHADTNPAEPSGCELSPAIVAKVQAQLSTVVKSGNGGIFTPNRMWSAVVDRKGKLCSVISIGDAWPGSRAIAIAKAETANDFSNNGLPLSTANLYSQTQPGGSLYGLNNSNPFNAAFLAQGTGTGSVPGGVITFGGGVALYVDGQVVGGLGVSGDSSCADHVISYRMREGAHMARSIPAGVGFNATDDIDYLAPGEAPNGFKHPHCFPSDLVPGSY